MHTEASDSAPPPRATDEVADDCASRDTAEISEGSADPAGDVTKAARAIIARRKRDRRLLP